MSKDLIESYLIRAGALRARGISGDPAMARSNVDNSSTRRSIQPAMSGNTRELATSLVEMKIALEDLPMLDVGASQGEDNQQPPGDTSDSLNPNPPSISPKLVWEDVHVDSMNVDALPTNPPADARDEADSAEDHLMEARHHVQVHEEAPLTGKGDAHQEQSDPSSGDRLMTEVHEEAPVTREGDAQQKQSDPSSEDRPIPEVHEEVPLTWEGVSQEEQCNPSSGDHLMTDASPVDPVDTGITEEPSNPSPAGVTAIIPFIPTPPTT